MIRVTQGHELGIGPEVFLKSFCLLNTDEQSLFLFYVKKETLENHLKICKIDYTIQNNTVIFAGNKLQCHFISDDNFQSEVALREALKNIDNDDILLTMPTSKDQLAIGDQSHSGYTEYLRKKFNTELSMVFSSGDENVLLVTDHIRLSDVTQKINSELIHKKVQLTLDNFKKYFSCISNIYFSGLNPHCGENGLLGNEDKCIDEAITKLRQSYPQLNFTGPISGDTLYLTPKSITNLDVYMYHDQGLGVFKSKNYVKGLNITLGLPFLRMSVDHGTAFDLYGKNKANYIGCHFLLKTAISVSNSRK